jgi:hypothetical protein
VCVRLGGDGWGWAGAGVQLLLRAHMRYFSPQVCFADAREGASGIFIVVKGWVELCLPVKQGGQALRILKRGLAPNPCIYPHAISSHSLLSCQCQRGFVSPPPPRPPEGRAPRRGRDEEGCTHSLAL